MSHPNPERPANVSKASAPTASEPASPELELPLSASDERDAERVPDLVDQANDMAARGQMSGAVAALRTIVTAEPANTRARAALAILLERRGDVEGAIAELTGALEIAPDSVELLCARATALASRGRFDPAELDLRRAARVEENNADVQMQLGMLFSKRARWREAIEPLLAAIAADRNLADAHYHLGEAYNHIDDLPAALASYEAAAALQPAHQRALKGIGIVLDRLGRPADAAAAYRRAREAQTR